MSHEDVIQRILSSRNDVTRKEVLTMIEEKKRKAKGFFTDEAAARVVASELDVGVLQVNKPDVLIKDLVPGLRDVTIVGRAITVYPEKNFVRSDKKKGTVSSLLIGDKSGTIRVVLWGNKASFGRVRSRQLAKFSHGYVRESLDGKPELHIGTRGDVQSSPPEAIESEYPSIDEFMDKIQELTLKQGKANVLGIIQNIYPTSEFKRRDETLGKVRRLRLRDDTDQIKVVFWNDKVDELEEAKKGDRLKVMSAKVRDGFNGQIELHVENESKIELLTKTPL